MSSDDVAPVVPRPNPAQSEQDDTHFAIRRSNPDADPEAAPVQTPSVDAGRALGFSRRGSQIPRGQTYTRPGTPATPGGEQADNTDTSPQAILAQPEEPLQRTALTRADAVSQARAKVMSDAQAKWDEDYRESRPVNPNGPQVDPREIAAAERDAVTRNAQEQAQAAQARQAKNQQMEEYLRANGQKYYTDANHEVQPVFDPITRRPVYERTSWQDGTNPKTGEPALKMRDQSGQWQYKTPSLYASNDVGDPNLYYRKNDGSEAVFSDIDSATKHQDITVARKAMQAVRARNSSMWKEALAPMQAHVDEVTQKRDEARQQATDLAEQAKAIQEQIDNISANPLLNEKTGWMSGNSQTDASIGLQSKLAALQSQQAQLTDQQSRLEDSLKPHGDIESARRSAINELGLFKAKYGHETYTSIEDERRAILKAQGKDPDKDPTLQSILAAKVEHAKAISQYARQSAGGSPDGITGPIDRAERALSTGERLPLGKPVAGKPNVFESVQTTPARNDRVVDPNNPSYVPAPSKYTMVDPDAIARTEAIKTARQFQDLAERAQPGLDFVNTSLAGISALNEQQAQKKAQATGAEPLDLARGGVTHVGGVSTDEIARRYGSGQGPVSPLSLVKINNRLNEIDTTLNFKGNPLAGSPTQIDAKLRTSLGQERDYLDNLYKQRLAKLPVATQKIVARAISEQHTSAAGAAGRLVGTEVAPMAAALAGFEFGALMAAPTATATKGFGPLVAGTFCAIAAGWLANYDQNMAGNYLAPNKMQELKRLQAIDQEEHPVALAAANLGLTAATFRFNPKATVDGLVAVSKIARNATVTALEQQAAKHLLTQTGMGTAFGVINPITQGEKPTAMGVTQSIAQMLLFGNSRIGLKASIQHIDNMFPDLFWQKAGMDAEEFAKTYPTAVRNVARGVGSPDEIAMVQRVNAAAKAAGVKVGDLARGRTVASMFDYTARATQKVLPKELRPTDRAKAGGITFSKPGGNPTEKTGTVPPGSTEDREFGDNLKGKKGADTSKFAQENEEFNQKVKALPGPKGETPAKPLPTDTEFLYEQNGHRYFQIERTPENPRGRTVDERTLEQEGFDTSKLPTEKPTQKEEPTNAVQKQSTGEIPVQSGSEGSKGVRVKNAVDQSPAGARQAGGGEGEKAVRTEVATTEKTQPLETRHGNRDDSAPERANEAAQALKENGDPRHEQPLETKHGEIEGEKIKGEWHAFAPEAKGLGIPRAEMPQIKAEHRGALVQYLKGQGIESEAKLMRPTDLKPTQNEYSSKKVEQARKHEGEDRKILVSSDNHVVDGHHQWMAHLTDYPDKPIKVIRLKAPIKDLLPVVKNFPSAEAVPGASPAVDKTPATAKVTANERDAERGGNQPTGERSPEAIGEPASSGSEVSGAGVKGELAAPRLEQGEGTSERGSEPAPAAGHEGSERGGNGGRGAAGQGGGQVAEPKPEGTANRVERSPETERSGNGERPDEPARKPKSELAPEDRNHQIAADDTLIPGGDKTKARTNLEALKLLRQLEESDRNPTPEEKKLLAQYVGWGGLPNVFNKGAARLREMEAQGRWLSDDQKQELAGWKKDWARLYDEVQANMTPEERSAAAQSTLNAHYTSREVIEPMWDIARRLGFKGGSALETSAGIGHFLGLEPGDLASKTRWRAVELDSITGRMLTKLYPQAQVQVKGFEKAQIPDHSADLIIGNVPFAKEGPMDSRYPRMSLHNYFFARGMDALKPGGIMLAITSSSTMDSPASKAAREWLAERGDLVGAIRLPNTAFKKNAGTEVTTDILIIRKRGDGGFTEGHPWINTQEIPTYDNTGKVSVNEYFARHPEMMLGRMSLEGTMYGGNEPALLPTPGADLSTQIKEAAAKLPENVLGRKPVEKAPDTDTAVGEQAKGKEGSVVLKEGKPYVIANGLLSAPPWAGTPAKVKLAVSFVGLREHLKDMIENMQNAEHGEVSLQADRDKLNALYDAHVKRYGPINDRSHSFLEDDPELPLVEALENVSTVPKEHTITSGKNAGKKRAVFEKQYSKAQIFTKRTIFPREEPTSADTVADAVTQSLAYRNAIDPSYVAELRGITEAEARKQLQAEPNVYVDPKTGTFEPSDAYLSGFVREKLDEAKLAAENDPAYEKNVKALEKNQPQWLNMGEISFRLGSSWLPPKLIESFLRDKLQVGSRVAYIPQTSSWVLEPRGGISNAVNQTTLGTSDMAGHELVEAALNLKSPTIYDKIETPEGTKSVKNPTKTLIAQQKQAELQQIFKDYVKGKSEVHPELEKIYNENYNGVKLREFSGPEWKHYPDASREITLRQHQKDVVARILQESTLLAHSVGTGKTFIMITAAMEARRLGLAKKPMIVTQNATTQQFAASFKKLYPTAKILVPTRKQRDASNRQRLMSMIATGDYDSVIIPQSFFNQIQDDPERVRSFIQNEIDELEAAKIDASQSSGKHSPTVKNLERAKKRLEEKLDELADRKTDKTLTFEQLGVDMMQIDEAHAYKKLEFQTQMDNIKELDRGASQRGLGLYMKTRWVQDKNNGKNVVLATGTPVSNTIAEAWNMLRFTRPDLLKKYHVEKFDQFASTFGDTITNIEQTAGGGFKQVTRFAKYANGPELINMFHSAADVVLAEDINLPGVPAVKNGQPTNVEIEQTPQVKAYIKVLRDRLAAFDRMSGSEKRANSHVPLVVFGLAKKATLDLRLIDAAMPAEAGSKIDRAVDNISKIYHDSSDVKGTQLVFSDLFQSPDGVFNLYHEIKRKLAEKGIPPEQVAIIADAKTDAQRERIFEAVKSGDIRVLLGSTEKMGTGVNVQDRLVALHHLDAAARPMDMEQRRGRIVRQGNQNPVVELLNYGVKNTLDATLYQRLAIKQKFINQIMRGDVGGRSFEDAADEVSMTFEEQMAAFSGNPLAMKKVAAEGEARRLEAMKSGYFRQFSETKTQLIHARESLKNKEAYQPKVEGAAKEMEADTAKDITGKVGGKTYTERKELTEALDKKLKDLIAEKKEEIGKNVGFGEHQFSAPAVELYGHPVSLALYVPTNQHGLVADDARLPYYKYSVVLENGVKFDGEIATGQGLITSFVHQANALARHAEDNKAAIETTKKNITEMDGFVNTPFQHEEALKKARQEVKDIDAALESATKEAEKEAVPPEHGPVALVDKATSDLLDTPAQKRDRALSLPLDVPQMPLGMELPGERQPERDRLRRMAETLQARINSLENAETFAEQKVNEKRSESLGSLLAKVEQRLAAVEKAGVQRAIESGDLLAPEPASPARADIIKRLQALKIHQPGVTAAGNPMTLAWDMAIDAAVLAVKAGRTLQQAAALAVGRFKERFPGATKEDVERIRRTLGDEIEAIRSFQQKGKDFVKGLTGEMVRAPQFTPLKRAINHFQAEEKYSSDYIQHHMVEPIEAAVPSEATREAMNAWIEANGNEHQLREWRDGSLANPKTTRFAPRYERALQLTPTQVAIAKQIQAHYRAKLAQGQREGFLGEGVENYVNHMWKMDTGGEKFAQQNSPKLAQVFNGMMRRSFPTSYDGEQEGMIPRTYDIAKVVAAYTDGFNRVSRSRRLLKNLTKATAEDGRPLAYPSGKFDKVEGPIDIEGNQEDTIFINPNAKPKNLSDYKDFDHPAAHKWKWAGEDEGRPVMLRGNLVLHPDAYNHINNMFGESAIRKWYNSDGTFAGAIPKKLVKYLDKGNSMAKATALGVLSPFHQVQEGTHAIGHRISPFHDIPEIDVSMHPEQFDAVAHGLMLGGGKNAADFMEGVGSGANNPLYHTPIFGEMARVYSDYLFHQYIPGLKFKTYQAMVKRNASLYGSQLSKDDIKYLSALQANNAYGHLNYADMGRNPTLQHLLRMGLLAPDFLEARMRFAGEAAQGAIPGKKGNTGREQAVALAFLAALMWGASRILNSVLDDDAHWTDHPFSVVHGNREYTMRSVPEDLYRLFKDSRAFIFNRLSPIIGKGVVEWLTGKNYRGEKVTGTDILRDIALAAIPINAQPYTRAISETGKNNPITTTEQLMGSAGIQVKRVSAINDTYALAQSYRKAVGDKEDTGTYPTSRFQQARYAIADQDTARAQSEVEKLVAAEKADHPKLTQHEVAQKLKNAFEESIFHPWTKSEEMDGAFIRSLDPEDKRTVLKGNQQRLQIWNQFCRILGVSPVRHPKHSY